MPGRRPDPKSAELVYAFLHKYMHEHGHPPTQAQIAEACYVSKTSVARCMDKLEAWGWIQREPNTYRSLQLLVELDVAHEWDK